MEMRPFGRLIPALVARRRLLAAVRPVSRVEAVPVEQAFGRTAARTIVAARPVPPFTRATWDGYAVRSRDTRAARPDRPVRLRLVGEVFAEGGFARRVEAAEAVAIATGAPLPPGTDGVVNFEKVRLLGRTIELSRPVLGGDRVAPPGFDIPRATRLVRAGEMLTAVTVGTLAACGEATVPVYARPIVAVVPNGNELRPPGAHLARGQIFESNNATLGSIVSATGGVPRLFRPVSDDPDRIEAALRTAIRGSDLVLATGGSSVGERDFLPAVFARLGRPLFHGIAVRPGKPTLAVRAGRTLVIGLPGHPTSCLSNMYWLVLPVLRRLARRPGLGWSERRVLLGGEAVAPSPGLATVVPLSFRGGRGYPTFRDSSAVTSLSGATGFALLPPGRTVVRAGTTLRVFVLDPPLGPAVDRGPLGNR